MKILIQNETAPLSVDGDGVVRVGGTRVTIDTIVASFMEGDTPEGIVQSYPSLDLADVYAAIWYYLRHREDLDAYLAERRELAERTRAENERRFGRVDLRSRLMARRARSGP